jgi:hypothetical protein
VAAPSLAATPAPRWSMVDSSAVAKRQVPLQQAILHALDPDVELAGTGAVVMSVRAAAGANAYSAPMTLKSALTNTWCGQLTAMMWTS